MSHLLKRTKKSCLKIFRKISSSKQLFAKKTDNDDSGGDSDTTNNNNNNSNKRHNNNGSGSSSSSIENSKSNNNSNNNSNCSLQQQLQQNSKAHPNAIYNDYATEIETSPMPRAKVNHSFKRSTESLPSTTYPHQQEQHHQQQQRSNKCNNNFSSNNYNNNKSSKFHVDVDLIDDVDGVDSPNDTILHKLTARLFLTADGYDFQRLQQLRSDTGSEVLQFDKDTTSLQDDIVFEKVNYKDDVRYFRHTPSNSSLDNFRPNSVATTPDYIAARLYDLDNDWQVNEQQFNNNRPWNFETLANPFINYGFQHQQQQQQQSTSVSTATTTPTPQQREIFRPTISMSLGSKFNGNLQNVIISEERIGGQHKLRPIIKWDINGNSLDDDDDLLPHEYLEDFDKRLSKRIAAVQQLQEQQQHHYDTEHDNESEDSSLRSSSTTLETWVDEDLIVENGNMEFQTKDNRCLIKA